MSVYFDDGQFTLHQGDVRECLRAMPDQSVQCVVTSPPYYGLRNYGVAGQIGLEQTPAEYIAVLVDVFREVRRVLKDDGTLWLNLGDSYAGSGKGPTGHNGFQSAEKRQGFSAGYEMANGEISRGGRKSKTDAPDGYKAKDLMMMPARVAIALCDDGWYLRSHIAWCKTSPMPESVKDRPTTAWESVFLLSKSPRYFWNFEAASEPVTGNSHPRGDGVNPKAKTPAGWDTGEGSHRGGVGRYPRSKQNESFSAAVSELVSKRNMRNVWSVGSEPYPDAHFATFPTEIPRRAILAGSRPGDTVLDIFMGSGTTALVAKRLGRLSVGIELNPDYCALAVKRAGLQLAMLEVPA